jgi:tRNA dimethylallyltransferase
LSRPALFLAGPTAVGKSALAIALAERLGGEIISVDSMQVYRGLDIGTDKPTAEVRSRLPHHLVDVVGLDETFDVARFMDLASRAEAEVYGRGRVPIFCGGTGLYFKAYLEGLAPVLSPDPQLRAELEGTPLAGLLAELERGDPAKHATIDRANRRRVVRAVEILRLAGRPATAPRADRPATGTAARAATVFALDRCPEDLRSRIDRRVDGMFASGLVEETRRLLDRGLERNRTAMQAIGYRQVVEHLRGDRSLADTIALVKQKTRRFAKRQMTWFRHQLPVQWISLTGDSETAAVAADLAKRWRETAL